MKFYTVLDLVVVTTGMFSLGLSAAQMKFDWTGGVQALIIAWSLYDLYKGAK
jgi:hypothetical protein